MKDKPLDELSERLVIKVNNSSTVVTKKVVTC